MLRVPGASTKASAKRTSVSKGVCGKAKEWAKIAEFVSDATQEDATSSSFWKALTAPPDTRLDAQLWEILRWWQKYLPLVGAELAPELQVPNHVLVEVLRRSLAVSFERGKKLQEEGDEQRHYAIIVTGRCRLRFSRSERPPKSRSSIALYESQHPGGSVGFESDYDTCNDLNAEGFIHIGDIRAGEPLGTFPGDKNVGFEAVCLERTTVLFLSRDDYENTLKHFQKQLQSQAIDFLRRHRLCPDALSNNLERMVRHFRHRMITKGTTIMKAGDPLRHIWFLREGCCAVLMNPECAGEVLQQQATEAGLVIEEEDESNEEETVDTRLAQLRPSAALGAEGQQRAAAEEKRNRSIAKYARGSLRCSLEGAQLQDSGSSVGGIDAVVRSSAAIVKDSGTMLGAEALLHEQQDHVTAKCSYTIKAVQDCSFYEADITMWKHVALCFKRDALLHNVNEQLQRRAQMIGRSNKAIKRLDKRKRELQKYELSKAERQKLRLPWNSDSFGAKDLEDVDDYLEVVFEHRRKPKDDKNKATLSILEGTKREAPSGGPAVNRLLREVQENRVEKLGKQGRVVLRKDRKSHIGRRVSSSVPCNPMGECVTAAQQENYANAVPSDFLKPVKVAADASMTMPSELTRVSSQPSGVSIFHQTELDVEVTMLQSSSVPILPRVQRSNFLEACATSEREVATATSTSIGGLESDDTIMRPDSQMSSLFGSIGPTRPSTSGIATAGTYDADLPLLDISTSVGFDLDFAHDGKLQDAVPRELDAKPQKNAMMTKLMKAFSKAVTGRSVLVLTDRLDVKKSILRSLLATEMQLCFAKTQTDVWHRLQDQKDAFHALIWDLTKSQVSVLTLLASIRQHERYNRLPIIVLSDDKQLPDVVRTSCNYVVFHPISTSILREALLWCFDRKAFSGLGKHEHSVSQLESEPVTGAHQSWEEPHPPSIGWFAEEALTSSPQI